MSNLGKELMMRLFKESPKASLTPCPLRHASEVKIETYAELLEMFLEKVFHEGEAKERSILQPMTEKALLEAKAGQMKASMFEQDWIAAKHEFGGAMGKRAREVEELKARVAQLEIEKKGAEERAQSLLKAKIDAQHKANVAEALLEYEMAAHHSGYYCEEGPSDEEQKRIDKASERLAELGVEVPG